MRAISPRLLHSCASVVRFLTPPHCCAPQPCDFVARYLLLRCAPIILYNVRVYSYIVQYEYHTVCIARIMFEADTVLFALILLTFDLCTYVLTCSHELQREVTERRYQENLAHIRHKAMEMGGGGSAGSSLASTGTSTILSAQFAVAFEATAREKHASSRQRSPLRRAGGPTR